MSGNMTHLNYGVVDRVEVRDADTCVIYFVHGGLASTSNDNGSKLSKGMYAGFDSRGRMWRSD